MKLLIVEDSTLISSRLVAALAGFQCLQTDVAATFADGLARFRQWLPELAILDIQLPGGTGIELLRLFKGERPATRILMFSNHPCYRDICQREGADAFFDKSADFEALTGRVRVLTQEVHA